MIKSLRLKNFQNHENTKITFTPGVNVITGSSDQGKSSIVRALHWVFSNRPQGFEFRNKGCEDGECVEVIVDLGSTSVTRRRSNRVNDYIVDYKSPTKLLKRRKKESQVFTALKGDVPEEVQKALNFADFTIQRQLDKHFLLSESPGEAARLLNVMIPGLARIEPTLVSVNRMARNASDDEKAILGAITLEREAIEKLPPIEDLRHAIQEVEKWRTRYEEQREMMDTLIDRIMRTEEAQTKLSECKDVAKIEEAVNSALDTQHSIELTMKTYKLVKDSLARLEKTQNEIAALTIEKAEKPLQEALSELESVKAAEKAYQKLRKALDGVKMSEEQLKRIREKCAEAAEKYKKECKKIKLCPLCETPF